MEGRKLWITAIVAIIVLFSPLILLNNASMGCYQRRIDRYPEAESSKNWQWRLAGIYAATIRPDKAAECYERFWQRYPNDPRRPLALEKHARLLEEDLVRSAEAIEVWKRLARDHPDDPSGERAKTHLVAKYRIYDVN